MHHYSASNSNSTESHWNSRVKDIVEISTKKKKKKKKKKIEIITEKSQETLSPSILFKKKKKKIEVITVKSKEITVGNLTKNS